MRPRPNIHRFSKLVVLLLIAQGAASAQEMKTFVAYSMKVAQAKVEAATKATEDFRKKQPDLYYLAGITKPWAIVMDANNGDWVLVGERDPKCSVLTLDDWVVALRARFIHGEEDPGVTIDPRPCEACINAGKREGCRHYTNQKVRFFGGIQNTHFGQICYEADWLMKKMALGLERLPIDKIRTYYDLSVEQHRSSGASRSDVASRFWFYPIVNRVNVLSDVVLLEKFEMGVFSEVLYAEIDGKPVVDLDKFEHYPSEGFSRSFSDNYDATAQMKEVLETLRGLTRLAALGKGLAQVGSMLDVGFYLKGYPLQNAKTVSDVEMLTVENQEAGFRISGGVDLIALATRLRGGDASALRHLVFKTRMRPEVLNWGFEAEMREGRWAAVILPNTLADPNQVGSLFQQAAFLHRKKRHDAVIELYDKILLLVPDCLVALYKKLSPRQLKVGKKAMATPA